MRAGSARVLAGAALGAILLRSGFALADDPKAAQELFDLGRQAMAREDYGAARAQFEASYAAEPAVGTLLNLAVCEEKSGFWTSAIQHLGQSLADLGADDRRRPAVSARRDELLARVPHVTLRVAGPLRAGVVVLLDGTPIDPSSLGTALPIDPGRHSVRCQEADATVCSHEIDAHEREALEWQIDLEPPPVVPSPPVASPPARWSLAHGPVRSRRAPPALAYWTGGVGLASLALGLAAGAEVLALKGTMGRHCDRTGCDPQGISAASSGETWSWVSTIATGIGVAGLGTSVVLAVTARPSQASTAQVTVSGAF